MSETLLEPALIDSKEMLSNQNFDQFGLFQHLICLHAIINTMKKIHARFGIRVGSWSIIICFVIELLFASLKTFKQEANN